jgi:O-antigen ligase
VTSFSPVTWAALGFGVLAVVINGMTSGNGFLAVLPACAAAGIWVMWRAPLRSSLTAVILTALVLDNPQDRPQQYLWRSWSYAPGEVFHLNLHNVTGISLLRFSLLELLIAFLAMVALARTVRGTTEDGDPTQAAAFPIRRSLLAYSAALVVFSAWGMFRGGDGQQLLWQVRQMAWMPVLAFLAMRAYRTRADQWRLSAMIVFASLCRAAEGIYYYQFICRPLNVKPEYVTTHSDSVLFVTALMIVGLCVLERPGVFSFLLALFVAPPVGFALIINNRRLAFVSLLVSALTVALSLRRAVRLWLARMALASIPLFAVYVVVGWNSTSKVFAPLASLRSAADSSDTSNQTRDIENGNLIGTFNLRPLMGSGFGHEYVERVHAYDIQELFPQYRYIAHNSVLWLWSQAGLVGFTLLWMPLVVGIFLALRTYQRSRSTTSRVVSMTSATVLICYAGQAYGDMGLQSWTATLILSSWLGALARLAVTTGAWSNASRASTFLAWPVAGMGRRAPLLEAAGAKERVPT